MDIASSVVSYNSGELLFKCVQSLIEFAEQSKSSFKVFVVDNASSDGSLEAIAQLAADGKIELIRSGTNLGFAAANNKVLASVDADYYLMVNPDCLINSDAVEAVISALENDQGMGVASCVIYNSDGTVQKTCKRRFPTPASGLVRMLGLHRINEGLFSDFDEGKLSSDAKNSSGSVEYVEAISGAFFCIKQKAMREIGLLDEGYFMHCEDLDYCMRAKLAGYTVGFVNNVGVTHDKGGSSRANPVKVLWYLHKGMLRFYRKFYLGSYPLFVTWAVYAGIAVRFVAKAIVVIVTRPFRLPKTATG